MKKHTMMALVTLTGFALFSAIGCTGSVGSPEEVSVSEGAPSAAEAASAEPVHLDCSKAKVSILEETENGTVYSRPILTEEIPLFAKHGGAGTKGGEPEAAGAVATSNAAPPWCNGGGCTSCAPGSKCMWGPWPIMYSGSLQWNEGQQACYCVGAGQAWNCCP